MEKDTDPKWTDFGMSKLKEIDGRNEPSRNTG